MKSVTQPNIHKWQTLITNVNLATMTNGAKGYGEILNGALAISEGKIAWLGEMSAIPEHQTELTIDGEGKWLTPGLVDCHTHIVFGGNRANEFEMRFAPSMYGHSPVWNGNRK